MLKYRFNSAQRYAIWLHNEQRCWLCHEPLRIAETTVDHVIPESMLKSPDALSRLIEDQGLPASFQVNGYENWLPAHQHCNSAKSDRVFKMAPSHRLLLDRLIGQAKDVERAALSIRSNVAKDKILIKVAHAIDKGVLSITDVSDFLGAFGLETGFAGSDFSAQSRFLRLDNGYWVRRDAIAGEGLCNCERSACVGQAEKVYCYFPANLSAWVVRKRLFHRCYDEIVRCPRCREMHRRGYIGREGSCARPYSDQISQVDTRGA
jgi:5-methylcytosine-specific restriction endonuclease McrA